jgi:hypothetical protein
MFVRLVPFSRLFRNMSSLETKAGYIALPGNLAATVMVLDKMTGKEVQASEISIHSLIDAIDLARNLEFTVIGDLFRHTLLARKHSKDGLAMLARACQVRPIDRELAKHALSLFQDLMPGDCSIHRQGVRTEHGFSASPALGNLRPNFVESLGVIGAVAYSEALGVCEQDSLEHYWGSFDWSRVPEVFVAQVAMMESQ